MRLDYALYALAVVFFILSGVIAAYQVQQTELWIVATAVLGLASIGVGYFQRPKPKVESTVAHETPPPPPSPTPVVETTIAETTVETIQEVKQEMKPALEVKKHVTNLKRLKGIGQKRAQQLKDLGISSVEDLANASAKDLASKLNISPKMTGRWIGNAKEMVKKT